ITLQPAVVSDPRALLSSGIIGQRAAPQSGAAAAETAASAAPAAQAAAATVPIAVPATFESLLPTLTPQVAFIDLNDGQVMRTDQTRVRVKGPLGAQLRLTVNGQELGMNQVGEQSSLESRGVTAWDYIGVNLKPGDNL